MGAWDEGAGRGGWRHTPWDEEETVMAEITCCIRCGGSCCGARIMMRERAVARQESSNLRSQQRHSRLVRQIYLLYAHGMFIWWVSAYYNEHGMFWLCDWRHTSMQRWMF
jgi:hypothetical protein